MPKPREVCRGQTSFQPAVVKSSSGTSLVRIRRTARTCHPRTCSAASKLALYSSSTLMSPMNCSRAVCRDGRCRKVQLSRWLMLDVFGV